MMNREQKICTVTVWGAVANLMLCAFKMVAGVLGRSGAMVADAVHSLSDLISDFVVLVMVKVSSKGRDKGHDYGHGKFETLATAAVCMLLLVVGARLMAVSIEKIHSVIEGGTLEAPGWIALWAAIVSILVKELLYQWTMRVGRKEHSPAMQANAWHHRSDALSSVGSAAGIAGAILLGGKWTVLDPIVGGVISIFIIIVAVKMALPAIAELTDASLPDEVEDRIMEIITSEYGVRNAHDLKTRQSGPAIVVDAHIVVAPDMSVEKAHFITTRIENALRREFGQATQVSLHIEPNVDSE